MLISPVRLLSILEMTFLPKNVNGQQEIVDMISKMADLDSEFDVSSGEAMDRLLQCVSQAAPFFSDKVNI